MSNLRKKRPPIPASGWRAWAMLSYSILTSVLLVAMAGGFILGEAAYTAHDFEVGILPRPFSSAFSLSLVLMVGSLIIWSVMARFADLLRVRRSTLLLYPVTWLLNSDDRLARRIRGDGK